MILALVSQKGGVGKSTLARVLAAEFTRAGWRVKIGDLDPAQGTSTKWALRRDEMGTDPEIQVQKYRDAGKAVKDAEGWDLMILDGPAHAERAGLVMARAADLVLVPTGYSVDDLDPQIRVAFDLESAGVDPDRIKLAFCRVNGSAKADQSARDFVQRAGLKALQGAIRELPCIRLAHAAGRTAAETGHKAVDAESKALAAEVSRILTRDNTKGIDQ